MIFWRKRQLSEEYDKILELKSIKHVTVCVILISFLSMSISCTQLSRIAAIFRHDEPLRGGKKSLFTAVSLPENSVGIDVYVIRIPYNRRELLERFWLDVDENEIPITVRNHLKKHGLRQGMLSSKIPVSFERLLDLKDIPPQKPFEQVTVAGSAMMNELLLKHWTFTLTRKQPLPFPICDDMIPKLPVLAVVDGKPSGKVYTNASGMILISTDEQPDGSVVVKTIPEIHYGGETRQITSEAGIYTPKVYKSKLQFDQLTVEAKLLLGQWVVIGSDMRQQTGFGRYIFSRGDGDPEQILIGIRLSQTSKDGLHDRNDIAVLRFLDDKTNSEQIDDKETNTESYLSPSLADQELGKIL